MTEIEKIEKICAEMGVNEKEMCMEIGINYSTLWRYYKGKFKVLSYRTVIELQKYVGLIELTDDDYVCTNKNSFVNQGCGEREGCFQNCDDCDYWKPKYK